MSFLSAPLAVLALSCLQLTSATAAPALPFEAYAFKTEEHGTIAAQVAWFEVPRRHSNPDGPRMRLRVVRLPARSATAGAAPIVYLAGGPGGSGVGTARGTRWPVFDAVRQEADVLLLDQRGTGLSEAPPACPYEHAFEAGRAADAAGYLEELRAVAARCADHWRAQGVDLDAYNTIDSAHDVEALRLALGVEKVSLWGMSYGTHLAMAVLRHHGQHVARVVLMGAEGPDDTLKLPLAADELLVRLGDAVRGDARAAELDPDLAGAVRRVLARLERSPAEGRVRRPFQTSHVTIGKFDAQLAIAAALGRTETARLLPMALAAAERGNYDVLAEFVHAVRQQLGTFKAMPLAMDVASGVSATRRTRVEREARESLLGPALNFPFPDIGAGLGIGDLGDDFRAPLRSDVPALFISGTLDGRTPHANAITASVGFRSASHLLLVAAGHDDDLWLAHADIPRRIAAFFGGQATSDSSLTAAPIEFAVSLTDEIWRALVRRIGVVGIVGVLAAFLTTVAGGWSLWARRRKRRAAPSHTGTAANPASARSHG